MIGVMNKKVMSIAMLLLVAVAFGCKKEEAQTASEPAQQMEQQEAAPAEAAPEAAAPAEVK